MEGDTLRVVAEATAATGVDATITTRHHQRQQLQRQAFHQHLQRDHAIIHPIGTSGTTTTTTVTRVDMTRPYGTPVLPATTATTIIRRVAHAQMWRPIKPPDMLFLTATSSEPSCPRSQQRSRLDGEGHGR